MYTTDIINIVKDSFEDWYNKHITPDFPVSILINYKDEQRLSMRAFHTSTIEVQAIGIKNNTTVISSIITLSENYNHGLVTEQEAKDNMIKKLLEQLYSFSE